DKWARKKPGADKMNDTVEIYKRLVGNFDFIRAKTIRVVDGNFTMINQIRKQVLAVQGINIDIDDFLVDSVHDYRNVLSYFIKQTRATINKVSGSQVQTGKIVYDSKLQILDVQNLSVSGKQPLSIKSVFTRGLSTDAFIKYGKVHARSLLLSSPVATFRPGNSKKGVGSPAIPEFALDSLILQKGNFNIYTKQNKLIPVKDVQLLLKNIKTVNGKFPIEKYLNPAVCAFSIGSVNLPMKSHSVLLQNIGYPNNADRVRIGLVRIKPTITRQQLKMGKQMDLFTMTANNINIDKFDMKKMVKDNTISIQDISLEMAIHIFEDKTIPIDSVKKGRSLFPYDGIRTSKTAIDIRSVNIRKSKISYEEEAAKSGMNGTIFFSDLNGSLTNITNVPGQLARDNTMKLDVTAKLMGVAALKTNWQMLLNASDGRFKVGGSTAPFPVTVLDKPFEALSMTSIRSGFVDKLDFEINGDRVGSTGNVLLNYHDLKIDLLKKNKEDSLEKKGFISFIANADVRNNHQTNKPKDFRYTKDRYKSFFNLLWKSVFEGAKNTILIVK
ncbi:MAG: hypothetical protein ABI581_15195, partial [Sediminibacterium sp.]